MRTIIGILTKATYPKWRIGPEEFQDWYKQCVLAVRLSQEMRAEILTASSFVSLDGTNDEKEYERVVTSLGSSITTLSRGEETLDQIIAMKEYTDGNSAYLLLIVTPLHYPRVFWLCRRRRLKMSLRIAFGLPRPREALTDLILILLYPAVDLLGFEDEFREWVRSRRLAGKL